jgi:hypothetical protein
VAAAVSGTPSGDATGSSAFLAGAFLAVFFAAAFSAAAFSSPP